MGLSSCVFAACKRTCDVGVSLQIPFFVDFDLVWQSPLKIAVVDDATQKKLKADYDMAVKEAINGVVDAEKIRRDFTAYVLATRSSRELAVFLFFSARFESMSSEYQGEQCWNEELNVNHT